MTMPAFYFLSFACTETCEVGVIEFDTYAETYEEYQRRGMSGYSVKIHDVYDFALVEQLRKSEGYENRTEA